MPDPQTDFAAVDAYLCDRLLPPDPTLDAALDASRSAGLPSISVAPNQGKLLWVLAKSHAAKSVLEIGTLGGYSTIWLARALPADGRLVTLELDPKHAHVARQNLDHAGVGGRVDIRVGPAADTLAAMATAGEGPFDFVFIDADKAGLPAYLDFAMRLTRVGSLIVIDNVVRGGVVIDAASADPSVQGVRRTLDRINADPRLAATAVQTVGAKGYDGFAIALVVD